MDSHQQSTTLNSLPNSMIAYIFQFHTLKDLFEFSKVNRRLMNALNQNFLWEHFASNEELFLPNEKEFFKWKDLFFYLYNLKKNIQSGKPNKNFKMKAMRSHKVIITAINYLYIGCSYKIISGDQDGILLTWQKDADDDYESTEILHAKDQIISIKASNESNNALIVTRDSLYLIHYDNQIDKNRFDIVSQYELNATEKNYSFVEFYNGLVYCSIDLHDVNLIKRNEMKVTVYDSITWKKANECILTYGYDLQKEIHKIQVEIKATPTVECKTKLPSFLIIKNHLFVVSNYDLNTKKPISGFNIKLDNCFIFNTNMSNIVTPKRMHIPLEYIYHILSMNNDDNSNRNDMIAFTGKGSLPNENFIMLLYAFNPNVNNCLVLKKKIPLEKGINETFDIIYHSNTHLCLWNSSYLIKVVDLTSDNYNTITLNVTQFKINHVVCDKYRIVVCYDTNMVNVYSLKTNTWWYSLMTGSLTIIPKSFVKHPNCIGFNNALISRWSIIGVLGNLIREYSFQPTYNK